MAKDYIEDEDRFQWRLKTPERFLPTTSLRPGVYLGIPATTLRSWTKGRTYPTSQGEKFFAPSIPPILLIASSRSRISQKRMYCRRRGIKTFQYRTCALSWTTCKNNGRHVIRLLPRSSIDSEKQLFVKMLEDDADSLPVNATKAGQIGLKAILEGQRRTIGARYNGYPIRIFPLHEASGS